MILMYITQNNKVHVYRTSPTQFKVVYNTLMAFTNVRSVCEESDVGKDLL